ncbi:MAG: aldo/keto reductase [bacterium]
MQNNIILNNGYKIPVLGLGTWMSKPDKVGPAVKYALEECGYRHIDCAHIYGNEKEIGQALNQVFSQGNVKREDVFITSKLWNNSHAKDDVVKACKISLQNLQLDYLDLYLIHWAITISNNLEKEQRDENEILITNNIPIRETWEAMEELVKTGLVRSIGVANFNAVMLLDLLSYTNIKPAINQIEIHPYNPRFELVKFCQSKNMAVTAYSPLGCPTNNRNQASPPPLLLEDKDILQIAHVHGKTPAQILIRWGIQRGIAVIPKSVTPEHIKTNTNAFDFQLSESEVEILNNLQTRYRFVNPIEWWGIPYFN